jgi:hypothetical protein
MESYFAHHAGPGGVSIQAIRLEYLIATSWHLAFAVLPQLPAFAHIRCDGGWSCEQHRVDADVSLRERFCNDLSSHHWQQGQTKNGNRSKALSTLDAYYPSDIGTVGVLSRVPSTFRPRNSFPLTSWRGSHETWVPPRQVSAGLRLPGPAVMCRRPDKNSGNRHQTPRKQRAWT